MISEKKLKWLKAQKYMTAILRIAIGIFFIFTAVLKIISIKEFEIYIYSYGIFNYALCTLFARCLIIFEILAGACMIFKSWYQLAWWTLQLSLLGFSVFLVFAYLRGDSNCHCLGDIIELNPMQSMMKNVALMIFMSLIKNQHNWHFKYENIIKPIVIVVIIALPFIVTPPEALHGMIYSSDRNINTTTFEKSLNDSTFTYLYPIVRRNEVFDSTTFKTTETELDLSGKNIAVFAHAGCKYCKQGVKKLAIFMRNNHIERQNAIIFIFGSDDESIYKFIQETESYGLEYRFINPITSIEIIDGKFPTFIMLKDSNIVKSFDLWGLDEKAITTFFQDTVK